MEFNLNDISNLIGSLGFPIVCCGYMMIVNTRTVKENTAATNKMVAVMERVLDHLNMNGGSDSID